MAQLLLSAPDDIYQDKEAGDIQLLAQIPNRSQKEITTSNCVLEPVVPEIFDFLE